MDGSPSTGASRCQRVSARRAVALVNPGVPHTGQIRGDPFALFGQTPRGPHLSEPSPREGCHLGYCDGLSDQKRHRHIEGTRLGRLRSRIPRYPTSVDLAGAASPGQISGACGQVAVSLTELASTRAAGTVIFAHSHRGVTWTISSLATPRRGLDCPLSITATSPTRNRHCRTEPS